ERLQAGVESLGAGELSARVRVEGHDEVAQLAESFNRAAGRIEELVGAHKSLLANASHELRTPLARIRMAVELMKESAEPKRKAELEQDIAELDALIDEILLASRLDALKKLETDERVDLLALAAEECARYDHAALDGQSVTVRGDPRLLRRMIRNLLENAKRHGAPPIAASGEGAVAVEFGLSAKVHGPIRLHPAPRRQDRAPETADPQEHLAQFLSRREDRGARPERLREIHAAEDHGRGRDEFRGRSDRPAEHEDRLPAAGTATRPGKDRARGG